MKHLRPILELCRAKSIFSKLEKLATDRVAFKKKIDCCIPLQKENWLLHTPQRVSTEGYSEVGAVSDDDDDDMCIWNQMSSMSHQIFTV